MLKVGQIVKSYQHGLCEVILVNECRARIKPLATRKVNIKKRFSDEIVSFVASEKAIDISPNAQLEVIHHRDTKAQRNV